MTELEERFMQYHREIDRAFLSGGATPFQITKAVWRLHAEMSTFLAIHAAQHGVQPTDTAAPQADETGAAGMRD